LAPTPVVEHSSLGGDRYLYKILKPPDRGKRIFDFHHDQINTRTVNDIACPKMDATPVAHGLKDNVMNNFQEKLAVLEAEMEACEQTTGMSVLRHGELVRDFYDDLIAHLETGSVLKGEWKLPDWVADPRVFEKQLGREIVREYARMHDCGKPSVRTVDEEGRQHFSDHAAASERIWLEIGGDSLIGRLIGMDMDIHTIKDADVAEFASRPEAATLMLIGLSEIHANASMFGGIDSVSFKMKWKQIDKRGRAILKQW
jgi:hypothetical protein